jgi:hypothetical protein
MYFGTKSYLKSNRNHTTKHINRLRNACHFRDTKQERNSSLRTSGLGRALNSSFGLSHST